MVSLKFHNQSYHNINKNTSFAQLHLIISIMSKIFFLFSVLSILMMASSCKKPGCMDKDALNYDSKATKDDGSCVYVSDKYVGNYSITDTLFHPSGDTYRTSSISIEKIDANKINIINVLRDCQGISITANATETSFVEVSYSGSCPNMTDFQGTRNSSNGSLRYSYLLVNSFTIRGTATKL